MRPIASSLLILTCLILFYLPSLQSEVNARPWLRLETPDLSFARYDLEVQGLGPRGMAAEDLNGDEVPDLVVANLGHEKVQGSQTLDLFFGRGDGTFELAQSIPVDAEDEPYGLAYADLRGIGSLDVIVPNKDANTVSVFLGRNDGTFEAPRSFPAGDAWSVTTADLDGDGKLDLAVANFDTEAISVLLGNGDGTFQNPVKVLAPSGFKPRNAEIGDLNGDGRPDLVATSDTSDGRVGIFLNSTNSHGVSFLASQMIHVGLYTGAALVHDFDGDGKLDIAASSLLSNHVSILMGRGDGTFAPASQYDTDDVWPFGLTLTDLDGDGNSDLIASGVKSPRIAVLLGDGRGGFSPPFTFDVQGPSRWVTWGDFDLDGRADIAVGNYTLTGRFDAEPDQFFKTVSILLNRSVLQAGQPTSFRVNCGGTAYTNARGITWAADSAYEGGKVITASAPISGSSDQTLFQSARQGDFTYTARVNAGRSYTVRLYFAEITPRRKKPVFDVSINGERVLKALEIRSRVPRNTATSRTIRDVWPDRSGQIRITFSSVQWGALCSAISIF